MKTRSLLKLQSLLLFMALFFFGFQQSADAQFRILNNTGCTVNFKVGQNAGCSACNPSGVIALPPSPIPFIYNANPALCGPEAWLGFKYFLTGIGAGSFGVSMNPDLAGACGPDAPGFCPLSGPIVANWFTNGSGTGPVTVVLN